MYVMLEYIKLVLVHTVPGSGTVLNYAVRT